MKSERNAAIITAYTMLFTIAIGVVAEDLWTSRNPPPAQTARKLTAAERTALASAKSAGAVLARTAVASR